MYEGFTRALMRRQLEQMVKQQELGQGLYIFTVATEGRAVMINCEREAHCYFNSREWSKKRFAH